MEWLFELPYHLGLVIFAFPILLVVVAAVLAQRTRPVSPQADGWTALNPNLIMRGISPAYVLFGSFMLSGPFLALSSEGFRDKLILSVLCPAVGLAFFFCFFQIWVMRVRFSSAGVEYRGLLKNASIPWSEVRCIGKMFFLNTYLDTDQGRYFVPDYFNGFAELVVEAAKHDVEIKLT